MGQSTHIVVVESSILSGLIETLQCGPGEEGVERRREGKMKKYMSCTPLPPETQ